MKSIRAIKVKAELLVEELRTAFGPPASDKWWTSGTDEALAIYFADTFAPASVQEIVDAHVALTEQQKQQQLEAKSVERTIDALPKFIFEILWRAENDKRELRRSINQLLPQTYSLQESAAITRLQYRSVLINWWKAQP